MIKHSRRDGFFNFKWLTVALPLLLTGCGKGSTPSATTAPTTAPAVAAAAVDAPAGYTVVVSTDSGKSLMTQKPLVPSVQAALMATFPDLEKYFGDRPSIGSAYQDAHDSSSGGATFGATWKGQPVRGIVSCKLHDGVALIGVIYGRNDAPKADWEKLMKPPAALTAAAPTAGAPVNPLANPPATVAAPAVPDVPLKQYDFPDGTGSVGLADGWKTQGQSVADPTAIIGPADQAVILHNGVNVSTPDSMAVRQRQQLLNMQAKNAAGAARWGVKQAPPKPLPPLMVAPFTDPVTAVSDMAPMFSARSEFNGGPSFTLDKILSSKDLECLRPGAKRGLIDYTFTRTQSGQSIAMRAEIDLIMNSIPGSNDTWMWLAQYSVQAPAASFDKDYPVMMAMIQSQKVNQERAQEVVVARIAAMQQMTRQMADAAAAQQKASFEQFQKDQQTRQNIHDQQMAANQAGYDAHNAQFKSYELQRSRNAADFNESIIGTRTIYDTVTGQSGYANLTDVNGVVDSLNQAALDPNRFVQIPLRDQLYSLTGK